MTRTTSMYLNCFVAVLLLGILVTSFTIAAEQTAINCENAAPAENDPNYANYLAACKPAEFLKIKDELLQKFDSTKLSDQQKQALFENSDFRDRIKEYLKKDNKDMVLEIDDKVFDKFKDNSLKINGKILEHNGLKFDFTDKSVLPDGARLNLQDDGSTKLLVPKGKSSDLSKVLTGDKIGKFVFDTENGASIKLPGKEGYYKFDKSGLFNDEVLVSKINGKVSLDVPEGLQVSYGNKAIESESRFTISDDNIFSVKNKRKEEVVTGNLEKIFGKEGEISVRNDIVELKTKTDGNIDLRQLDTKLPVHIPVESSNSVANEGDYTLETPEGKEIAKVAQTSDTTTETTTDKDKKTINVPKAKKTKIIPPEQRPEGIPAGTVILEDENDKPLAAVGVKNSEFKNNPDYILVGNAYLKKDIFEKKVILSSDRQEILDTLAKYGEYTSEQKDLLASRLDSFRPDVIDGLLNHVREQDKRVKENGPWGKTWGGNNLEGLAYQLGKSPQQSYWESFSKEAARTHLHIGAQRTGRR